MPRPQPQENLSHFMGRFMGSAETKQDFPARKQRVAVALSLFRRRKAKKK